MWFWWGETFLTNKKWVSWLNEGSLERSGEKGGGIRDLEINTGVRRQIISQRKKRVMSQKMEADRKMRVKTGKTSRQGTI